MFLLHWLLLLFSLCWCLSFLNFKMESAWTQSSDFIHLSSLLHVACGFTCYLHADSLGPLLKTSAAFSRHPPRCLMSMWNLTCQNLSSEFCPYTCTSSRLSHPRKCQQHFSSCSVQKPWWQRAYLGFQGLTWCTHITPSSHPSLISSSTLLLLLSCPWGLCTLCLKCCSP